MKPALILVGADKGGVGKTTVARLLLDYLAEHEIETRAFDSESPRGTLKRFFPDIAEIVDMTQTGDQMKIIDTLEESDARVTVVDVNAGRLQTTLEAFRRMGFLDAAGQGEFTFLLFHVLGSSIASLDEISEVAPYAADAHHFVVKNHINDTTFFEWDPQTYRNYFGQVKSATEIEVPRLNEVAYEQVDHAGVPFRQFIENRANSFVLRGYVRTWLRSVFEEFDRARILKTLSIRTKAASGKVAAGAR